MSQDRGQPPQVGLDLPQVIADTAQVEAWRRLDLSSTQPGYLPDLDPADEMEPSGDAGSAFRPDPAGRQSSTWNRRDHPRLPDLTPRRFNAGPRLDAGAFFRWSQT